MPSPFERLTGRLEESRRQSATDWVENKLGEAEGAVRDKWKRLAELRDSRNQLRDKYTDTAADLTAWQEQRMEIQRVIQEENMATAHWRKSAYDLLHRANSLQLLSKGTSTAHFTEALTGKMAQFGKDMYDIRNAVDPLVNEEPPAVLPQYSLPAQQQPSAAPQADLATAVLDTLPPVAPARSSPPSAPPPPYSPSPHSPTLPTTPAFRGPGSGSGSGPRPSSR